MFQQSSWNKIYYLFLRLCDYSECLVIEFQNNVVMSKLARESLSRMSSIIRVQNLAALCFYKWLHMLFTKFRFEVQRRLKTNSRFFFSKMHQWTISFQTIEKFSNTSFLMKRSKYYWFKILKSYFSKKILLTFSNTFRLRYEIVDC